MGVAYLDASALLAVAFNEEGASLVAQRLEESAQLVSSNLLEAEARAAFARENLRFEESVVFGIEWVLPERSLSAEMAEAQRAGYLRGGDLWHVASALYAAEEAGGAANIAFITLDERQRDVAQTLGFQV